MSGHTIYRISIYILFGLLLSSCNSRPFIDLDEFETTRYFKLSCIEDPKYTQYISVKGNLEYNTLLVTYFNNDLRKSYSQKLLFTQNEAKLLEHWQTMKPTEATVTDSTYFLWNLEPSKFQYKYVYSENQAEINTYTRTFLGQEVIKVMGKSMEVLKFKDIYTFGNEGKSDALSKTVYKYFSRDYFLVKQTTVNPNGSEYNFILTKELTSADWKELTSK